MSEEIGGFFSFSMKRWDDEELALLKHNKQSDKNKAKKVL